MAMLMSFLTNAHHRVNLSPGRNYEPGSLALLRVDKDVGRVLVRLRIPSTTNGMQVEATMKEALLEPGSTLSIATNVDLATPPLTSHDWFGPSYPFRSVTLHSRLEVFEVSRYLPGKPEPGAEPSQVLHLGHNVKLPPRLPQSTILTLDTQMSLWTA